MRSCMKFQISEKEQFKYRPCPFFFLTTCDMNEYTDEKVKQSLIDLKTCGFGGLILFNKPPAGFNKDNYLKDDWFIVVEKFAKYSNELGLNLWINDGFDYPPGNVAGRIYDINPTLCQKHIVNENGKLTIKNADWGFPAWENKRANNIYQTLVYEEYKRHVGKYFGNTIVGFFTDGDNRRVEPPVMFDENHKCRNYFPWTDNFDIDFKEKYGYDIMPYMFDVMERKPIPQANDYWEFAGLCYQRWIKSNHEWMIKNGLLYTGHTSDSAPYPYSISPRSSALTEGRFSDIQSNFDYPGTDQELLAIDGGKHLAAHTWYTPTAIYGQKLNCEKMKGYSDISTDTRTKQASSTAFIYNKKEVMSEMFAATNYAVSPTELRQIFAFQAMQGATMVVPHAYHYRFFGCTKYFAPPEFSSRGIIGKYIKEFNDEISKICFMLSTGKPIYPIALLDPTEGVWQNNIDFNEYTKTFSTLNRMPHGFIICDYDHILSGDYKVVVISGIKLPEDKIEQLTKKGLTVLYPNTLQDIDSVLSSPIDYSADGPLMFSRRIINDEEFIFIANIENQKETKVSLSTFGKNKSFTLFPGQIKYISKTYDDIDDKNATTQLIDTITETKILFDKPNFIPLETFKTHNETTTKIEDCKDIDFIFSSNDVLNGLKLYIPENCFKTISSVLFDGKPLHYSNCFVYDDSYREYTLPTILPNTHTLTLCKNSPLNFYDRIFITGEFDAFIDTDRISYKKALSYYNLDLFIAKNTYITLSKRSLTLKTNSSWAEQGQPFYSGKSTYYFSYNFIKCGKYRLNLEKVRDIVEVSINNKFIDKKIYPPYTFDFEIDEGLCNVSISVTNSLGNEFECYLEDSGLLSGIKIEKILN